MPESSMSIDFGALKRALAGSDASNPVNCAVILLPDRTASLKVDRRKSAKALAKELMAASKEAGEASKRCFLGKAYMDEYPGMLSLTLNKAPSSLSLMLRVALRGSGFNKVEITVVADEDESEEG